VLDTTPLYFLIRLPDINFLPSKHLSAFPKFISWVVASGITFTLFSSTGLLNAFLQSLGKENFDILNNPQRFLGLVFLSDIWKTAGWSSIIYLAAITSVSFELYEAAIMDGAGRLRQFLHVTWPCILPTVSVMLILSLGNVMNAGFDQIFNLYNPIVRDVTDIIDTYMYRITFAEGASFSFSAAVGLFKSIINFVLLLSVDRISKAIGQQGLY
jgi:putative aldouronate transport system permease protein